MIIDKARSGGEGEVQGNLERFKESGVSGEEEERKETEKLIKREGRKGKKYTGSGNEGRNIIECMDCSCNFLSTIIYLYRISRTDFLRLFFRAEEGVSN